MDDSFQERPGSIPATIRFRTNSDGKLRCRKGPKPLSEVVETPIEWFWEPYIPLGRLTMLGGDPGAGKSFITTALSATFSRGDPFPGEKERREPGSTLMLSVEDDAADTIKPRVRNLRGDLTRVFISEEDIVLDEDGLKAIRQMIAQTGAKFVIIDPIVAFLGPKMDMNRANEVRHIMKGLAKIAKETNIAILVVRHNRKEAAGQTGKAIYAGMGSIDFTASVRSELAVTTSKNDTHFLNHIKTNSGRKGQSLTYSITALDDGSGLFAWGDFAQWPPTSATSKSIGTARFRDEGKVRMWLHDLLTQHPDGMSSEDVFTAAKLEGYSLSKLNTAKKGVAISEKSGKDWRWRLDPGSKAVVQ